MLHVIIWAYGTSCRLALREKCTLQKAAAQGEMVDDGAVACTTWKAWRKKVDAWRVQQGTLMPGLWTQASSAPDSDISATIAPNTDVSDDEDDLGDDPDDADDQYIDDDPSASSMTVKASTSEEILGLPSDLNADERREYDVELLAEYEYRLCIGQAFDILEEVRQAVQHLAAHVEEKKHAGHTTKDNMRSADISKYSRAHCQRVAKRYNYVYDRMLALRTQPPSTTDPAYHLKRIDLSQDLTIANLKVAREKGDSKQFGSWIWWAFENAMDSTPASAAGKRKKAGDNPKPQAQDTAEDSTTWCAYSRPVRVRLMAPLLINRHT